MKINFGIKLTVLWIILIYCLMLFFLHRTEVSDNWQAFPSITTKPWAMPKEKSILPYTAYWDSQWYLSIAKNGYSIKANAESNVVFFPLYPTAIKIVKTITNLPWNLAGSLISILAIITAVGFLYVLIKKQWSESIARRSIFYMLIFPSAFFFSIVYTESLFIMLAILCFYNMDKQRWWLVGLMAALAVLTKTIGIILFPIILLGYLMHYKKIHLNILWLTLPIIALGAWMMFCQYHFGDWLSFAHGQQFFHRPVGHFSWQKLLSAPTGGDKTILFIDGLSALLALTAGIILLAWKKFTYGLYVIFGTLIPLASGTLQSMNRYVLILFPLFIVLAVFSKRYIWFHYFYIMVMPMLLAMHLIQFVHFAWAG